MDTEKNNARISFLTEVKVYLPHNSNFGLKNKEMPIHTILGANGTIANELVPILRASGHQIRLVCRKLKPVSGAETFAVDVLDRDQVFQAVKGSDVVYLLVGLEYKIKVWRSCWPIVMRNTIEACKATGARLIFFDNVYMYGKTEGRMTEGTPFRPSSKKGMVRAEIAEMLIREMKSGELKALIARSADFYGPRARTTSVAGLMVFEKMKKGKTAQWFVNAKQPHSFTYTPDAAKALYMLATSETAYGQTWHLPSTLPAISGTEFIAIAAKYMQAGTKIQVVPRWLVRVIGLFIPIMEELVEMLYQNEYAYEFDSSKFEKAFEFRPTSYEEGIKQTAEWFLAAS